MQKDREKQQLYEEYVKKVTPTHSLPANMVKAFLVGGLICVSGQAVTEWQQVWMRKQLEPGVPLP